MNNHVIKTGLLSLLLLPLLATQPAQAHDRKQAQAEPITLLVNYHISGNFTGMTSGGLPIYTIGGPGYVPKEINDNGIVSDAIEADHPIALLEGAQITFEGAPTDAVINFTCLPGSCKMTFKDGSILVSNAGVDLQGRAINMWGPVVRSPNFDPINQIYPIRILGCGGLKEVAGKGRLAGMVGSICFNGVLNFNQIDPSALTGSSKCTITLHTPAYPSMIP
jgi:hypothetical protein